MSLTSLITGNTPVRQKLADWFPKPRLPLKGELIVPSVAKNRSLIGIAYDYLLRFHLERAMPYAKGSRWIAQTTLNKLRQHGHRGGVLVGDELFPVSDVARLVDVMIEDAEEHRGRFLAGGPLSRKLIQSALDLAHCDVYHRIGRLDARFGCSAHDDEILELRRLVRATPLESFTAKETCLLNPDFGAGSTRIGGADADLLLDETLIDVKTTINLQLRVENWRQLIAYAALNEHFPMGGGYEPRPIRTIGVYFARHGLYACWPLRHLVSGDRFAPFALWLANYANSCYADRLERQVRHLSVLRRRLADENQHRSHEFKVVSARMARSTSKKNPRPTIERARTKYRPKTIHWLLIAEAPPAAADRFFYFEDVRRGDLLFLETVRALFEEAKNAQPQQIRDSKIRYLAAFKREGFYLIDVCDKPIERSKTKGSQIRAAAKHLASKLDDLRVDGYLSGDTKIVLVSKTVHDYCYTLLHDAGFNVVNSEFLPFPSNGHQKKYRKNLASILRKYRLPASM